VKRRQVRSIETLDKRSRDVLFGDDQALDVFGFTSLGGIYKMIRPDFSGGMPKKHSVSWLCYLSLPSTP